MMMSKIYPVFVAVCVCAVLGSAAATPVSQLTVTQTSLVSRDTPPLQQINLSFTAIEALAGCGLKVWSGNTLVAEKQLGTCKAGANKIPVMLPEPGQAVETRWVLSDGIRTLAETTVTWQPPRHWTLYVIKSSHIDIGLHNAQYRQRHMTDGYIDEVRQLADQTADWPDNSRYRYMIEGLWWWQNYVQDRPQNAVDEIVEKYIKPGIIGLCASHSGNHTQVYSNEEMCRSAYYMQQVRDRWGLPMDTMVMADNNGLSWPLVTAYADAGIRYLCFFPNYWNPVTVGESRHSAWFDSQLPHVFYWQGPDKQSRIMVWASPHYTKSAPFFGFQSCMNRHPNNIDIKTIAPKLAEQLALLEAKYPYDVWLVPNYSDDEPPNTKCAEMTKNWNARWRWPEFRTSGDISIPFRMIQERFGNQIPTLSGMITGGWAQHPLSTPTLLALKFEADRLLPVAEKLSTLARLTDPSYDYPDVALQRAWDALVCNDEHGYGTSVAYKGRPLYETWMQKRDWIGKALATAETESERALKALATQVSAEGTSIMVFNPTLQSREETVAVELPVSCARLLSVVCPDGCAAPVVADGNRITFRTSEIPSLGYALFRLVPGQAGAAVTRESVQLPSVENAFYRVMFGADGAITSLFDKELERELLDRSAPYRCNQFVYTRDANKTFTSPSGAHFEIETSELGQTVIARMEDSASGAALEQRVTLPAFEKRIEIDNRLAHVRGLAETNRWYQFGYYAFPFNVPEREFRVGLNGCDADPYKDQTGHGTDTYHAPRDWSYVGNDSFGIALIQMDSQLIECGRIHIKKNTFGEQPANAHIYSSIFNNWLYGHAWATGPSHINLHYRYVITSHAGGFRDSAVARFAQRVVTPLMTTVILQAQKGTLTPKTHSFLSVDAPNVSLLALKMSEVPGRGVIARFQETDGRAAEAVNLRIDCVREPRLTRDSITEQDRECISGSMMTFAPFGLDTLRIEGSEAEVVAKKGDTSQTEPEVNPAGADAPPAKVGSFYTGLIDAPRASRADSPDRIYLQWGENREKTLSHYEVYRSERSDFEINATSRIATVKPGQYVTRQYEDKGLKTHTAYYYRILAVDSNGRKSEPSDLCEGLTREPLGEK